MLNLYGNGLIGRVDVNWIPDSVCVEEIPGQPCTWEYYDRREDDRFFYFKDHLGSIHMTLDENSNIVSAQDYYPYGEILRSYTTGADVNSKYRFTEKERDTETNYDYFGARYYDSELARWLQVDPLADKYPGWSPYNYALNNPLKYVDPDGRNPIIWRTLWYIFRYSNLKLKEGWGKKGEDLELDGIPDNRSERDRRISDPKGHQKDKDLQDRLLNGIQKEKDKQFQKLMELSKKAQEKNESEKDSDSNANVSNNDTNLQPTEMEPVPIDFSKPMPQPPVKLEDSDNEKRKINFNLNN